VDEWYALPWWQSQIYSEGLREEFSGEENPTPEVVADGNAGEDSSIPLEEYGLNVIPVHFG
jgi:hypothetical protein